MVELIVLIIVIYFICKIFKYLNESLCSSGVSHDYKYGSDLFTCGDEKVLICRKCGMRKPK